MTLEEVIGNACWEKWGDGPWGSAAEQVECQANAVRAFLGSEEVERVVAEAVSRARCNAGRPDDVYPAPDFETALKWETWAKEHFAPTDVISRFTVAIWPWSPERHADGLAASIAEWALPTPESPA